MRTMIIDGSHLLHRALRVPEIWELRDSKGRRTGGVMQFFSSLESEISKLNLKPVVVFDGGINERRRLAFSDYKKVEQRAEIKRKYKNLKAGLAEDILTEEEAKAWEEEVEFRDVYYFSIENIMKVCKYLGIPVLYNLGSEGDDLIAIVSRSKLVTESVILSDDKDLLQLVNEKTRVRRAIADQLWDLDKLIEVHGSSRRLVVTKAIVGDGSDNVPQIKKGVGEKKAQEMALVYCDAGEGATGEKAIASYLEENQRLKWVKSLIEQGEDFYVSLRRNLALVDLSPEMIKDESIEIAVDQVLENYYKQGVIVDLEAAKDIMRDLEINSLMGLVPLYEKLKISKSLD